MLRRVPQLKGLNLRQSEINRPAEYAQDLRNVEKNSKGEIILRWGYEKVLDDPNIIDLFEYVGAEDDPNRGVLLALKADGIYRLESGTLVKIPEGNVGGAPVWSQQTKPVEYNKVLYWNDPSGEYDLWKFDGYSQYRAGVPRIGISGSPTYTGTAGTHYFRVILKYYDTQGNVTWSDNRQYTGTSDEINLTLLPLVNDYYNGFYQKYILPDNNTIIVDSLNLTADLGASATHNYVAGDYMILTTYSGTSPKKPIRINSVTATTITFNASDIGSDSYILFNGGGIEPAEYRYAVEVYRSGNPFSGYTKIGSNTAVYGIDFAIQHISTATTFKWGGLGGQSSIASPDIGTPLESVYDDSLIRVLPPKGKYLALFGEQMVIGRLEKDQPDFGYASLLSNDSRLEDSIVWSDIPTLANGSSVETFLVNNIRSIGVSEDGAVKAIHGNDDSLVVHKEKQSYYVNGDFISNTLRVRKAMAEQTGAGSHRSIRDVEGGHLYTTPKGVFLSAGGQKPIELSDIIEPLFTDDALSLGDLDLQNAKSITDFLREKIYIYVPITGNSSGIVLVYDYYYKEWFLHDNIPANQGFQDVGITSTDIYFADSTSLYRRTLNTKKDLNANITGYYWTGWFDLDFPSLLKQFNNLIIGSIRNNSWIATIKGYCNWIVSSEEATNTLEFDDKKQVMDTQVLQVKANSVSYRISNESDGSDLKITYLDVNVEDDQRIAKGDV
jgi:hypothetical protein